MCFYQAHKISICYFQKNLVQPTNKLLGAYLRIIQVIERKRFGHTKFKNKNSNNFDFWICGIGSLWSCFVLLIELQLVLLTAKYWVVLKA